MLKPDEYRLGESVFYIRRFEPFTAMKVLGDLQKIILPALGAAAKEVNGIDLDSPDEGLDALAGMLGGALAALPQHVDGAKLENAARMLLNPDYVSVSPDGLKSPVRLSEDVAIVVFEGRVMDMFAVMAEVFRVNFMDFSKLSSVPTGTTQALGELKGKFQVLYQKTLNG